MAEDIASVKDRDPAARSALGIVLYYPGYQAVQAHRLEHWYWTHGLKAWARFHSQVTRHITGVEIHPGAQLGRRVFIDHGMGVVVGETTIIGDDVTLYQGVTLGGTGKETGKRHPTIENGAVIGVGASVLGNITVGEGAKVGGGAVVVRDVPAHCSVVGIPGHIVTRHGKRVETFDASALRHQDLPDPLVDMMETMQQRIESLEKELHDLKSQQ